MNEQEIRVALAGLDGEVVVVRHWGAENGSFDFSMAGALSPDDETGHYIVTQGVDTYSAFDLSHVKSLTRHDGMDIIQLV